MSLNDYSLLLALGGCLGAGIVLLILGVIEFCAPVDRPREVAVSEVCVYCGARAEYDSPRPLCLEHWCRWLAGMDPADPYDALRKDREKIFCDCFEQGVISLEEGEE